MSLIINKFRELTLKEKRLLFEAFFFLLLSKFIIVLFPLRKCIKFFRKIRSSNVEPDKESLQTLKTALDRANHLAFWKNKCLVQSFAAKYMLQRRGRPSLMFFGVAFNEKRELVAHAWLKVGEFEIVPKGNEYKELFCI